MHAAADLITITRTARASLGHATRNADAQDLEHQARPHAGARGLPARWVPPGADLLALTVSGMLASTLLAPGWRTLAVPAVLLLGAKPLGLYASDQVLLHRTTLDELPKIVSLAGLAAMTSWLQSAGAPGRWQVLLLWSTLTCLMMATRTVTRALVRRITPAERCLLIGEEATALAIRKRLHDHAAVNATLVARVSLQDFDGWAENPSRPLTDVRYLARMLDIQRAIIAPGDAARSDSVLDLMIAFEGAGVRVSVLPRLLETICSSVDHDDLQGIAVAGVRRFQLSRPSATLKRTLDLCGASVGLLAMSPFMLATAIAIKLDSRGPVFFRQVRVGRHGAHFQMLKFRTMVEDAEALKDALVDSNQALAGLFKITDDPRITRVGRLLRKTSLDELPQLLNVLRGEMSLVGPRPLVLDEDNDLRGWHRRRLELSPGITGHWQILGPARASLHEMASIDYLYAVNWSLWTDTKLLLRTLTHVVGRRGL